MEERPSEMKRSRRVLYYTALVFVSILILFVGAVLYLGIWEYFDGNKLDETQGQALGIVASAAGALAMLITILYIAKQIGLQREALDLQGQQIEQQGEALKLQGEQMALQDEALGYSYRPGLWLQVDKSKHSNGPGVPISVMPTTQATVFSVTLDLGSTTCKQRKDMTDDPSNMALFWKCEAITANSKKWCGIGSWDGREELKHTNTITVKWKRPVSGGWEEETQKWTLRTIDEEALGAKMPCQYQWEIVPNPPEEQAALDE